MKFWYRLMFLPILIFALVGCSDDDENKDNDNLESVEVEDGKVTQFQKHSTGNGIPIVIMCDGFSDMDIASGKYRRATTMAFDALFSVHPMTSLREYFDVYEVTAVSSYSSDVSQSESTASNAREENVISYTEYAHKAIAEERFDDAVIVVISNKDFRSYCNLNWPDSYSDIPTGIAIAFVSCTLPLEENIEILYSTFPAVVLHEVIGHGFAKLADEYVEEGAEWDNYDSGKKSLIECQKYGYYRNVSYDSDVTKSNWADFAADSRYDFEKLGCYEGGYYQEKGVYRPTENSIMNHTSSSSYFNVISRVMIYKRCMKLAYGDSWEFNYEDFVNFDLEKAKVAYKAYLSQNPNLASSKYHGAPPRFVKIKTSR